MMLIRDLVRAVDGWVDESCLDLEVSNTVIDSRSVSAGSLFFALKGENTNGHLFVDDVVANGGLAVVSEGKKKKGIVLVEDVKDALLRAASWNRSRFSFPLIGITGSSGKTTTRELLAGALREKYSVYCTSGNLNNDLGVPLTLLNIPEPPPDIVVLEMGMNHPGELALLGEIASPTACLVTNIGTAHIEYFESRDGIARAKAELIEKTAAGGFCVIPKGEQILCDAAEVREMQTAFSGIGGDLWVSDNNGEHTLQPSGERVDLHFCGGHNYENAVSALLMSKNFGLSRAASIYGIQKVRPMEGRGRVIDCGRFKVIDESYNANPESTIACLNTLVSMKGRSVAVLGDMLELGSRAEDLHSKVLDYARELDIELLILTGDIYRSVVNKVQTKNICYAADWMEAEELLQENCPSGSIVLIKGSRAIALDSLVRALSKED